MPRHSKEGRAVDKFDLLFNEERDVESFFENKTEEVKGALITRNNYHSIALLIPIFLFEILVCVIGSQFYISIGYSNYSAIVLAVSIESFYMYFSSRSSVRAIVIKLILLTISITTLSYSAYLKDANVRESIISLQKSIAEGELRLVSIGNEEMDLKAKEREIEDDMKVYREHSKVSKGNKILGPRRLAIDSERASLKNERLLIKKSLKVSRGNLSSQGVFKNINILSIQTIMTILTFAVIQLSICIALPELVKDQKNQ
jgi:hypothetical protein